MMMQMRYVIDFYTGVALRDKPVSMYLDVRPALDSFDALTSRLGWQAEKWMESMSGGFLDGVKRSTEGSESAGGQQQAS